MTLSLLLLGILTFLQSVECSQPMESIVDTPLGRYRGSLMTSTSGREFLAFRGVRYAKPPTGALRFEDPVAVEPFTEIFDATKEGPTCIQNDVFTREIKGSEDCLALNIYTAAVNRNNSQSEENLKPVLVWIHGGGWFTGSGNDDIHGPHHFMDQDIVLVTINYRLGPFGFLSTEDEEAPGNYGLLDQTMALKWVRDNIQSFGGDSGLVTLVGQSVGAASVQYHMLTEHSKGLFHRAIIQSGSSLCPWATPDNQGQPTRLLANKLNCPIGASRDLVSCLRSRTAQEIVSNVTNYSELNVPVSVFGPRIDFERQIPFLPSAPIDLMKKGTVNQVPLIIGVNQNESAFLLASLINEQGELKSQFKENPEKHLADLFPGLMNDPELVRQAMDVYLDQNKSLDQQINNLEQMVSDGQFLKCIDDNVILQSFLNSQPTYYYVYSHRGENSVATLFNAAATNLGVGHGDEILLMFSNKVFPTSTSEVDTRIRKTLVQLWTSFAYEGKPRSDLLPVQWLPINCRRTRYLNIDAESSIMDPDVTYRDRLWFWTIKNPSSSAVGVSSASRLLVFSRLLFVWAGY